MCFFPYKNNQINSPAYKKGVREFKCGACPECLAEKSRYWALRCSMQAMEQVCCMVTLTYDTYVHDTRTGRVIGERVSDLKVCKSDAQKFIKRVREYFARVKSVHDIKYLITAEYGKRTNRAHYHAILFGVEFDDLVRYKKSKRGNWINKSATLDKLWSHGICTVDTVCVNAKIARYCTKYCAKDSRADDTFMLYSRGIGAKKLLELFNGKSYVIDGREYPIPRSVWCDYIEKKYNIQGFSKYKPLYAVTNFIEKELEKIEKIHNQNCLNIKLFDQKHCEYYFRWQNLREFTFKGAKMRAGLYKWLSDKYLSKSISLDDENALLEQRYARIYADNLVTYNVSKIGVDGEGLCAHYGHNYDRAHFRALWKNQLYRYYRDNDTLYKRYLKYWQEKSALIELGRADVRTRILQLPNSKYFAYKNAALNALNRRNSFKKSGLDCDCAVIPPRSNCVARYSRWLVEHLPILPPCYKSANDRHENIKSIKRRLLVSAPRLLLAGEPWADGQISVFD